MTRLAALALASLLTLGLAACSSDQSSSSDKAAAAPNDPAATIERSAADLRAGDLVAVIRGAVPPEQYERMRAEWRTRSAEPPTDEERQQFAETMTKLTAADAEAALYAELEPQLEQMEREMAAQLPMMVGMGRGFAMQSIQQSEQLTAEQKKQAGELIDAIANWLQGAKFFDRDLARQAIAKVVATARALDLQTLDQARALEFEAAMQKGGIALRGLYDVLGIYGLSLPDTLASVDAETLTRSDDQARVKVAYVVFNQPLSFEAEMVQLDGRWYGKDALAELEKAAAAPSAVDDVDADEAADDADDADDADEALDEAEAGE
jgi:NADH dehydrogenase/NADH:ubiquinone oxidoreductase subunit G